MRIAVVSTNGTEVNEHFGRADRFLIYEKEEGMEPVLQEERGVQPLSVGDQTHAFDEERFDRVAGVIADCARVYVARIGERPAAELRKRGVEPVVFAGLIADI